MKSRSFNPFCIKQLLTVTGFFATSVGVHAAARTWSGATNSNWGTSTNWSAAPVSGDSLVFTSATGLGGLTLSDNLMTPGTFNVVGITFNAGSGAYVINPATAGTNGFTLTGNVTNNSTSTQTINDLISVGASRTITTVANGNTILGGKISGVGGITIDGAGTLTLSGASDYSGNTSGNSGATVSTLVLSGSNSSVGTTTFSSGDIFQLNSASNGGLASGLITIGDTTVQALNATRSLTNNITHNSGNRTLTISGSQSLNLNGVISASTGATEGGTISNNISGGGILTIGGNVYIGAATGSGFTRIFNGTGQTVVNGGIRDYSGGVGTAAGKLTKSDAGTLILAGTNTYTGSTTISAGTLTLADNAQLAFVIGANGVNNKITGAGTATLQGDFNLNLAGANTTPGNEWTLVDVGIFTETFASTFSLVGFTESSNVHTKFVPGSPAITWTFTEATGKLTVSNATDYNIWLSGYTFAPGANTTETGDADNDGLKNRQEYAFGLDPSSGSSVSPITVMLDKTTGSFTYTRRKKSLTGLSYKIETSTTLDGWTEDMTATELVTGTVGNIETVQVTLSGPLLTSPSLFVRVAVP